MDRLLTKADVCEVLGVSLPTLNRILADGDLPRLKVRRQVRISQEDLRRYLSGCQTRSTPRKTSKAPPEAAKEPARRGRPKGSGRAAPEAYYPGMRVV